ncbi:RHS repeat-associated core domain-containing protein [Asticcacaulis solisilvae]|uniref:RHS repeat-associated core domain-containing protein n=1 Tax=Asticcacaulis solisilvae TaxID=1217274 RepID=UPI003159DAF3
MIGGEQFLYRGTRTYCTGRLTSVTEQSGGSAFTYDAQGRVTTDAKTIQGVNYNVGYAYDANGQVTETTLPSGRVITFARDNDGLITGITTKPTAGGAASAVLSSMAYAPFGGLTSATYGNGLTLTRTFNTNDWLTRIAVKDGSDPKLDLGYTHYDDGRLGEIVDNAATGRTVYMSLSNSGRLTYANGPWGQESYAYDAAGNRTGSYLTVGGVTTSNNEITAGNSNRLVQVQDASAAVKRQLTYRTGGDLYSDAISGGATYTYQYSARKRLVGVQNNGADAAWYGYDFREQRVWRRLFNGGSSTEIHYIFDQTGHLLAEHNGYSGGLLREYVWADDMPVAVIDKTSGTAVTYFIHNGHLNEPQMMADAAKAKVWDAYVTPFGSAKVFTTATANVDIRLPGQWYQAEAAGSGLNQNHHRDYDPSLGRYMQVDPIGLDGGQNPYAYVDGMVYDWVDPKGQNGRPSSTPRSTYHIGRITTPSGYYNAQQIQYYNQQGRNADPSYRGYTYVGNPDVIAVHTARQMAMESAARAAIRNGTCLTKNAFGGETYAAMYGRTARRNYPNALGSQYQYNQPLLNGLRPDAINWFNRIVREPKPDTPSGRRAGQSQVNKYVRQLESQTGEKWTGHVDFYSPPKK